jgi:serine/threonine protein kinase
MNALATTTHRQRTSNAALEPGVVLGGKYQLDGLLGAGAMGQVWRARNLLLDVPVAIKVVEGNVSDLQARQRLLNEARFEAQLRHSNIVRVLDVHDDSECTYVVMELLEGCTVAELMDEGPLPPALVVRLMLPLLDALHAAHRAGIVHRDIKPENLFIARSGGRICPKLLDFGIAHCETTAVRARPLAAERIVMGTPGYMSPEQARGDAYVDPRADIWALGVVMYEAIRCEPAFPCEDYTGFVRALESHEPPALATPDTAELGSILSRAMAKDSDLRFPTTSALSHALVRWLMRRGVSEDLSGDSLPHHWATPGSPIDRAFRRVHEQSELGPKPGSHARTRSAAKSGARTSPRNRPPRSGALQQLAVVGRRLRASRVSRQVAVLSALCGVTFALAQSSQTPAKPALAFEAAVAAPPLAAAMAPVLVGLELEQEHTAPRPAQARASATNSAVGDKRVTARGQASAEVQKSAPKSPKKPSGDAHQKSAQQEPPHPRARDWKTGSAYSTTGQKWPSNEHRGALRREAAELGLKSPW